MSTAAPSAGFAGVEAIGAGAAVLHPQAVVDDGVLHHLHRRWDELLHQGVDLGRQVFAVGVGEFGTKLADEFQGRAHGVTLSLVVR